MIGMEGSMGVGVPAAAVGPVVVMVVVVWIGGEEASDGIGKTSARDDPDEDMSGTAPPSSVSVSVVVVAITTSTPSAESCGRVVAHAASLREDKPAEVTSERMG